jgi:hypothetical protein
MLTTAILLSSSLCAAPVELSTDHLALVIGDDGSFQAFVDRATGEDYAAPEEEHKAFWAVVDGEGVWPSSVAREGDRLNVDFGDAGRMVLAVDEQPGYVALTVEEMDIASATSIGLCHLQTSLPETLDASFVGCALTRNDWTKVDPIPGPSAMIAATAYAETGYEGASVAIVGSPPEEMRGILQSVIEEAPDLPTSPLGGPFALDAEKTRSSYIFNFGGLTEDTADEWIERARSLGFDQIQIHGSPSIGGAFRFGDCALSPEAYPDGRASLRRAIDRIHDAGILVGMQPYAFFVSKESKWVTPVPDPGLKAKAEFTLADGIDAEATAIPVRESTADVSTITGFFVRNSVTLRIDDELIVFSGVTDEAPFTFTGCQRGAHGTTPAAHEAGAKAYHLNECFGLFLPDPESDLFEQVAQANADFYNECGFDAIYFDALDGQNTLGGGAWGWHYGSRYVYEVFRRLDRPAIMEMSTFNHHLWVVRSRLGAWDHPNRCHKLFIDAHVDANRPHRNMFLSSNLGWWAFVCGGPPEIEPTYPEDIDYLCAKALGTDSGLSITTYDVNIPLHLRLAEVVQGWQELREADLPASVVESLATPGAEFTLVDGQAGPAVHPVTHTDVEVAGQAAATVDNPYAAQAPSLRIEALHGCGPWDADEGVTLIDPASTAALDQSEAAEGVSMTAATFEELTPSGDPSMLLTMSSERAERRGSWARVGRVFDEPLNLGQRQAVGVWIHGDGKGELLNFQLESPYHLSRGIAEHYVTVDFEGWRYFELIEPDADRWADQGWPYGHPYFIYREYPHFDAIESVDIWCNNLPPGEECQVLVSEVRALPLRPMAISGVEVRSGESVLRVEADMETNFFLEVSPDGSATLYDRWGNEMADPVVEGSLTLPAGESDVSVVLSGEGALRAEATVGLRGPALE